MSQPNPYYRRQARSADHGTRPRLRRRILALVRLAQGTRSGALLADLQVQIAALIAISAAAAPSEVTAAAAALAAPAPQLTA